MASSGSYNMTSGYGTIRVEWWVISQNIGANTTRIGWRAVATWSGSSWITVYACRIWINGAQVLNRGQANTWGGQFASGEIDIGHNSNGTKAFGSNGEAAIYTAAINASGSGSWDLPTIPRNATMTNAIGSFNDESAPWFDYSNPAAATITCWLEIRNPADTAWIVSVANRNIGNPTSGRYTWSLTEAERNQIRTAMTAWQTTKVRIVLSTNVGGQSWSFFTRDLSIINATPTFSEFSYKDSNPATVAITGDDQYIIQGQSTLQATILDADKMQTKKQATPVRYRYQIGSIDTTQNYATGDLVKELGTVGVNSTTPLIITAVDSRNLTTAATKPVSILPYVAPQINPTAERVNNFETSTKISVSGIISRLTVGGTDKNAVNTTNGLQYRYKKTDTGTWGAWQNIASTTSTGNVSMTDFYVNLDRNFAWNVEFRLTDKITSNSVALIVSVGIPIFRIGADGKVYNNEIALRTVDNKIKYDDVDVATFIHDGTARQIGVWGASKYPLYKKLVTGSITGGAGGGEHTVKLGNVSGAAAGKSEYVGYKGVVISNDNSMTVVGGYSVGRGRHSLQKWGTGLFFYCEKPAVNQTFELEIEYYIKP